jgi:RimJ/RimL family protein N-acetyltransferase
VEPWEQMDPLEDHPPGYPFELVELAFLDDGTPVEFRPILPADTARLERMFYRLSPKTLYRRFFTPVARPQAAMLRWLCHLDYRDRLAIVVVISDEIVAVARYDRLDNPDEAEVAVTVEDAWQKRGLATRLLWRLTAAARERGIRTFIAGVQGENRPMMGLLRVLSDELETSFVDGNYEVRIGLAGVRPRT